MILPDNKIFIVMAIVFGIILVPNFLYNLSESEVLKKLKRSRELKKLDHSSVDGYIILNDILRADIHPMHKYDDNNNITTVHYEISEILSACLMPLTIWGNTNDFNILKNPDMKYFTYVKNLYELYERFQLSFVTSIIFEEKSYLVDGFEFKSARIETTDGYIEDIILPTYESVNEARKHYYGGTNFVRLSLICLIIALFEEAKFYCELKNKPCIGQNKVNLHRFWQEASSILVLIENLNRFSYDAYNRYMVYYGDVIDRLIDRYMKNNSRWVL